MPQRKPQTKTTSSQPPNFYWISILLVGGAAFLVYVNALGNGFVYDDHFLIERNTLVQNWDVWGVLTTHYWGGYEGNETGQYRPITVLSFLIDGLGGVHAFRFHLSNVLLHMVNSILAFVLCRQVGLKIVGALFVGLLFALHPIHAEVAAGVTFGRADLLAALGVLATLLCYIKACKDGDRRFYAVALGAFLFGLLSKESALTVLGPIVVYDLYKGQGIWHTVQKRWAYWVGFGGIFLFYLFLRWVAAGLGFEAGSLSKLNNPLVGQPLDVRLYTAAALFWKYVGLVLWPAVLSVDYSFRALPIYHTPWHFEVVMGFLLGIGGIAFWGVAWKKGSRLFFYGALFWAPYAAISQTLILINAMFQERFFYVPVLGIFMVLAVGFEYMWQRHKQVALIVLVFVLIGCIGRTWARNKDWQNDLTLYQSAVKAYPNSAKMQHALADELAQKRQWAQAEAAYRRALAIKEDGLTWNNLGNLYAALEQFEAATHAYRKAVSFDDGYVEAWTNWGLTAMRAEKVVDAISAFERVIQLSPQDAEAHYNLGIAYSEVGKMHEAALAYAQAVALRENWSEAYFNLANAYRDIGQKHQALSAYQKFLTLWRGDPKVAKLARQEMERLNP